MLRSVIKLRYSNIYFRSINKKRSLSASTNKHSDMNEDFFTAFKKRVEEETAKEDKNLKNIHKSSQFRNLKKNLTFINNTMTRYIDESKKLIQGLYSSTHEYIDISKKNIQKYKLKYNFLNEKLDKIYQTYETNIKTRIPQIDNNSQIAIYGKRFMHESTGFFFNDAPKCYNIGCSKDLWKLTHQLENSLITPCERTSIMFSPRKGIDYIINDLFMNFSWMNRIKFFIRNSENSAYKALNESIHATKRLIQGCFVNKDYIDTYKNIFMFNPNFNKELFLYNWENIIIPGLIDAIVTQRDMDLVKKWTTSECFQLLASSKDFFDTCKVVPIILDVYDTDIVTMKKMDKSSSSLILLRFSVIVNQKIINPKDPTKSTYGPGYKELIVNWAIQTNPSHSDSGFDFLVADFGSSIASFYGYTTQ